ncbi:MAG TPA: hypothetical protein VFV47_07745, partial [Hyphomicrobiaceae bacterium]|nr:hypothetical protein [Hyphomicrobiaceae bacterium]
GDERYLAQVPAGLRSDVRMVRLLAIECLDTRRTVPLESLHAVAIALAPFLAPEELRAVWDRLMASNCFARMGERHRTWMALYSAVGRRDAAEMARLAETRLRAGDAGDEKYKDYLLGSAVTGYLVLGAREKALALWREFAVGVTGDPGNMLPELLRGHLAGKVTGSSAGRAPASPK